MYLPESRENFLEILTALRDYAEMEGLAEISELLSDTMQLLAAEIRKDRPPPGE